MVIKTNFGTKQASEFNLGLVRFATPDEAILGIHTNKAVTPKGLNEAINSINGLIYDIVLLADNWEGATAPYTYTINSITNIDSNTNAHTMLNSNVTEAQILAFRKAMIIDGGLSTDTVVFKAFGIKPTINIPIKIIISKSLYIEDDYEPQYEVDALPRATVDIYGTVRIATPFDVEDATSNIRVITPLLLAKNMPNGVAGLDASSLIYDSYISDNIARVNSPALTGTPTAPTAVAGTNNTQLATTSYVKTEINSVLAVADALVFKGTLGTGGTITTLPTSDYLIGWTYKVITAGTYAGHVCEIGDMIVSIVDFDTVSNDSDWVVIPNNLDGAVVGPVSAINNHIPTFNGTTGKLIKDSGYTIETSVPVDALFTDTVYTHPESGVVADTYTSVTVDVNGHVTGGTNPTTLSGYGITDAATLDSPALTGTPTAPTAVAGTNNTQIATTSYADALVAESITDGVTGIAPSQNAVFNALALKADITYVNTNIDEYKVSNLVPTYIDSTSFSVSGDHTGLFTSNRMLRIYDGSNTTYIPVTSSSYDGINEITTVVSSGTVPIGIEIISYGILQNSATEIIRHEILNNTSIVNNYKSFTATSSQTNFDISDIYQHSNIIVFRNGIFQLVSVDYTLDDTSGAETVVLTNPCSEGETVVVYFNTLELTI